MPRLLRPLRKRVFIGCEGQSERSYVKFLSDIANLRQIAVHLDTHVLKEGDPLSRLESAIRTIKRAEATQGHYAHKFAILDFDQYDLNPQRTQRAESLADHSKIALIGQKPDHEGFLCRHFTHLRERQLLNKRESLAALQQAWPSYQKNQTAAQIGRILDFEHVILAAASLGDFKGLAVAIGFVAA